MKERASKEEAARPRRRLFPRRFPPTREGWWFLLVTLVVGAAAINAGVNLLFLVFGMMIFLILASGLLSDLCLRGLEVTRRLPTAIHAGTPYLMGIAVRNGKSRLPTFSLEVEDLVAGKPVDRRCYYLKLPAARVQETAYRNTLHRRGYHQLTGFRLSTRFPFGLIRKSLDVVSPTRLLVYPALCAVPDHLVLGKRAQEGRKKMHSPSRRGDFYGLREFRAGDDPRDIHWRASARRGRLFLRESESESSRVIAIVLEDELLPENAALAEGAALDRPAKPLSDDDDTGVSAAAGNEVRVQAAERFEAAVSLAASLALHLLRRGYQVGLVAGGAYVPAGSNAGQSAQILEKLALVQMSSARPLPTVVARGLARIHVRPSPGSPMVDVFDSGPGRKSA
jgi:uncharacterized protein (DUF58 family)